MNRLEYLLATDARHAVALAQAVDGAQFLGGGTNLVDLLKLGVVDTTRLIDVARLADAEVKECDGGIRIGAAACNADVAATPLVQARYPALAYALLSGASGQIRNMATVGGNFLQRTRCRYFQDPSMPCNKRLPGSGCPAVEGEHHNLAILGASPRCVATHPSDMAVAMSALDAELEVVNEEGAKLLPIRELYRAPSEDPSKDSNLEPGTLISGVRLPPFAGWRQTYRKVRERTSFAFAIASTAIALQLEGDRIEGVRIAFGAVAHKPWRAEIAERALVHELASPEIFRSAIDAELREAQPLRDNGYKIPLITEIAVRALSELAELGG